MARIAKSDVYASFDRAAALIRSADVGGDGRISRADIQQKLTQLTGTEHDLVDIFYKFIDHRDAKAYAKITGSDIDKAVAFAKEHMVGNRDLNHNGLAASEVASMSKTAQLAVQLAAETKAAAKAAATGAANPNVVEWA